jgi:exoribonuclease-2
MERFWCLRWLRQQGVRHLQATVLKGDLLRLDGLPWVGRLPALPDLARGTRIRVDLLDTDDVDLTLQMRLVEVLPDEVAELEAADEEPEGESAAKQPVASPAAGEVGTAGEVAPI